MTEPIPNEKLLEGAKSGDRAAFAALLDLHLEPLRRFLFRLGASDHELDDLTQEVFVVVIRGLQSFRREARFSTWLFGIAVNAFRAARRGAARGRSTDTDDEAAIATVIDPRPTAEERARDADESSRMRRALDGLPLALREAFVLRHVEEMEPASAAEVLGVPEGTLRRRVFEARERLRALLDVPEPIR